MSGAAPALAHPYRANLRTAAVFGAGMLLVALAAALPGTAGLALGGALALTALFARFPVLGVATLAAAIPFDQSTIIRTGAVDVSGTYLVIWALIAAIGPRLIHRRAVRFDRMAALWLLVVVALVASAGAADLDGVRWLTALARWLLPAGVYLLLRSMRLDRNEFDHVLVGVAVGVIATAALAARQALTLDGPESFVVEGTMRVYGPFAHPNQLAAWLAITLPLLATAVVSRRRDPSRAVQALHLVALAVGTGTLLLTQSRTGLLAFLAAGAVILVGANRRVRLAAVGAGAALLFALAAAGMVAQFPGADRFGAIALEPGGYIQVTMETWAQEERKAHWGAAWSMLEVHPLTGVGAGGFEPAFREHTPDWRFRIPRGHAHNGYLHLGAEAGVPGFLAFTAFVTGALVLLFGRLRTEDASSSRAMVAGATTAMVAFAVASLFEYLRFGSFLVMVALILAIGCTPSRQSTRGSAT